MSKFNIWKDRILVVIIVIVVISGIIGHIYRGASIFGFLLVGGILWFAIWQMREVDKNEIALEEKKMINKKIKKLKKKIKKKKNE